MKRTLTVCLILTMLLDLLPMVAMPTAAAEIPGVVGSMFATGALYMVTVLAGAGIGTGAVLLTQKSPRREEEE